MNKTIITPAESDTYLSQYSDWLSLPSSEKVNHIAKASVYVQTRWECSLIDWEDPLTFDEIQKEAVAYYSYADSAGVLYGDVTKQDVHTGKLHGTKNKVGSLITETTYFRGGASSVSGTHSQLAYPDSLMQLSCSRKDGNVTLVRT